MKRFFEPPLIVALDVASFEEARRWVDILIPRVRIFKIGSILFTRDGPRVVEMVRKLGGEVFLDLKFHDIPNTVAKACEAAASLGVFMLTLHASGGKEMLEAASLAIKKGKSSTLLVGVTILTSQRLAGETSPEVVRLAALCRDAGLDGVVCSAMEAEAVRKRCGMQFLIVTPGIRPASSPADDQQRISTPGEAIRKGADFIVVGRPILAAPNPSEVVDSILREISDTSV